jgi:ribosome maturation protein SDO1
MKELHFAVIPNRSAKQQALEVIKKLQKQIPIARAKMKIQVTVPKANGKKIKETLLNEKAEIVQEVWGENARLIVLINPGSYRVVDAMIQENASFNGSLEVLELSVHEEGEHNIDDEISKKTERMGLTDTGAGSFPLAPTAMKMDTASSKEISTTEKKGKQCSTCGGDFGDDVKKYRDHFRSEWHRYNLKLKSRGHPIVDEETFEKLDRADVDKFFETLS